MQSLINYLLIYFITSIEDLYHYWWWHTWLAFLWSSSNSSQDSYKLIDQVQCTMSTFSTTFFVIIICIKGQLCTPEYRVLQVEQIFNDRVVVDNILADYDHSSSSLCTVLCQQENCECFGFNSVTQTCRVHAFCRPDNTIINESRWKYYRTSKFC